MPTKTKTEQAQPAPLRAAGAAVAVSSAPSNYPLFGLQRTLGNQAMMRLFESGIVQPKLRVSQPGDADEQEADRAAEQIVSRRSSHSGPVLQRKCACGGTCSSCQEEEQVIHRSAIGPLRSLPLSIQRAPADDASNKATAAQEGARQDQAKHPGERPHTVVVEDNAPSLAPGQMRKTEFLNLLQTSTCATADAVLESVNHTTKGCPYIKKWLSHYKDKDAQHLMRAMYKYEPQTVRARSAHEAIALVNHRVQRAALSWAKTGKVSDLPEGLQEEMSGGFLGAVERFARSGFGSALLGFLGGGKEESGEAGGGGKGIQRKSRDGASAGAHDAAAVKEQLGSGHALDGRVQGQMSSAFGYDFSGVRVHTDAKAGELSGQLNARAFTIGSDVAFAGGEYKPGTMVGDALIAHELAHVVQQGGGKQTSGAPQTKDASSSDDSSLEQDADRSAVGAVVSAWAGARRGLAEIPQNAIPRLRSGLKLQRCSSKDLLITGVSKDPDPRTIFFDRNSADIDSSQEPKIPGLKNPRPQDLTLFSFVSEDENVPPASGNKLAHKRAEEVGEALRKDPGGHTGGQTPTVDTASGKGKIDYRQMRKVIVKPVGVSSGQPNCGAGAEIPCAPASQFTTAQSKAGTLLTAAITALGPPVSAAATPFLDSRFGSNAANRATVAAAVKTNLAKLKTHIAVQMAPVGAKGPPVVPGHRCVNDCDSGCGPGGVAYNNDQDADALMTLCDSSSASFMKTGSVNQRAATLIHEGLHGITLTFPPIVPVGASTAGTTDFAYDEQRLIKFLDPATALQNTDSYVLFVRQVNGEAVTIGRPAPDPATGPPLSGADRDEVDQALAWLEGWLIWAEQETSSLYDTIKETIPRGAWTNSYYQETMGFLAPLFDLTVPPALPKQKDQFALAAIHDRLEKMSGTLFSAASINIERRTSGDTHWGAGPTRDLVIGPDFFAFPAGPLRHRSQLDLLLRKMLEAHGGVSKGFRHKYEVLIDKIRAHQGGGTPPRKKPGNQAAPRALASGGLQAKLRVSQPGDASEQEADRIAEQIVSRSSSVSGPVLQRKCACGGTCSSCQEEEQVIHRSAIGPLRAFPFSIQRAAVDGSARRPADVKEKAGQDQAKHPGERPHTIVVEDDAPSLAPGQMSKTEFLSLLQSSTCATADAVLESHGRSTKGCPYIKKWLEHYRTQDVQHLTRAMRKYAPETARARSAHEAIALVNHRVERAALSFAKTGKVGDLPQGIQEEMAGGGGFLGAVAGFASSGFGGALLGFLGGGKKSESGGGVQRKARDGASAGVHDAAEVRGQLGSGHSLDGRVQSRMSAAFGYDFSGVRVHTDAKAGELSGQLNARAFTVGSDVAFAGGEYRPGTLMGDALIAHELAHVMQQGGGKQGNTPQSKDASLTDDSSLEHDADRSAVGAMVAVWRGTKTGLAHVSANALPRLKSSLKLQKFSNCNCNKKQEAVKQLSPQETVKQLSPQDAADYQQALNKHVDQQKRVKQLLESAKTWNRDQSNAFAILQNSVQWLDQKKFLLAIMTPTHDSTHRKDNKVAYFDHRTTYPTEGGDYDPTGASDDGVLYRDAGELGEAPPVPPGARGQLNVFTVPILLRQEPVDMEDLSGTIVHETQHMAARIEPVASRITNVGEVERLYRTEFNSYWLQTPIPEQACFPGGVCVSQRTPPLQVPGMPVKTFGQDFGLETNPAVNETVEGSAVREKKACRELFPGVDFAHKKETTNFKSEKQQRIFKHLITTYGDDLFDCSYVCSGAFKATVDGMRGPVGVNLVNSVRIDAFLDLVDSFNPKLGVNDPRIKRVLDAVDTLDDVDKAFLRGSLPGLSGELKEEAKRKKEEEEAERKAAFASLSGSSATRFEHHDTPGSFWLYLSRKMPEDGLKKVQDKIRASRPSGKKP